MGAGCHYTHKCNKQKASWVTIIRDEDELEDQYNWTNTISEIGDIMESLGYVKESQYIFVNKMTRVKLESNYNGDGIIIYIEENCYDWNPMYNLFLANFDKIENKILRKLSRAGFEINIATSGFTSTVYIP